MCLPLQTVIKNGVEFIIYTIYENASSDKDGDGLLNDFESLNGLYIIKKDIWDSWDNIET